MTNIYKPFGSVVQRNSDPSSDPPSGSSSPDNSSGFVRTTQNLSRRNSNVTSDVNNDYSGGDNAFPSDFGLASGAFVDKLRSYCIISDNLFETSNALEILAPNLTPAYIRLTPREFDRFFVRNGSWSYGNNYHFICEFDNQSDDVREADYSPSIL